MIYPLDEQNYLDRLKNQVKTHESLVEKFKEKQITISAFLDNVSAESVKIHEYTDSINDLWRSLLKRIVINPRFSEADLLSSSTYRNKPIAKVSTKLHGTNYKVADVASEAQLTDLQLTFMLAMAKTYQWSPWKALLLDDPTQHHDLVHASSVFDLLRDFMSISVKVYN
jgi:DNA repair protein SbcC/Rad50